MKRHLDIAVVTVGALLVAALGTVAPQARAQQPAAPALIPKPLVPARPIWPARPESLDARSGGVAPAGNSAAAGAPPAPEPLPVAAPPPDPPAPQWGDYSKPFQPPFTPPTMQYTLAAPPRGIVQPSSGLDYPAIVTDPDSVLPMDIARTQGINLFRPDGIAPAGVIGDHTLQAGQVLVSYRYQGSFFDHNYVGSHQVSDASVQTAYAYVGSHLSRNRHMALLEYAPTDDFTFLAELPFYDNSIAYTQAGAPSYGSSYTNIGDVKLSGLYVLFRRPGHQLHAMFGVSAPVGIEFDQSNPVSPTLPNLPYDLRVTSGTWDLLPGLTYRGQSRDWTWGAQATGVVRTGINAFGYRLGSQADLTAWLARRLGERWSVSGRLDALHWGNVYRADPSLNVALASQNDPGAQGGERLSGLGGVNYYLPDGRLPGQRLSVEAGLPIYQRLSGPQLGLDWIINASWNLLY